jgi:hypothetical protein
LDYGISTELMLQDLNFREFMSQNSSFASFEDNVKHNDDRCLLRPPIYRGKGFEFDRNQFFNDKNGDVYIKITQKFKGSTLPDYVKEGCYVQVQLNDGQTLQTASPELIANILRNQKTYYFANKIENEIQVKSATDIPDRIFGFKNDQYVRASRLSNHEIHSLYEDKQKQLFQKPHTVIQPKEGAVNLSQSLESRSP